MNSSSYFQRLPEKAGIPKEIPARDLLWGIFVMIFALITIFAILLGHTQIGIYSGIAMFAFAIVTWAKIERNRPGFFR